MINATSGISCTQNVRFISGISAISGVKVALPNSYQALYPFSSDFLDQVSDDYEALLFNEPSFGGGGINTAANTNISVTTFQADKKGLLLDKDGNGGVVCKVGNRTDASTTNGVLNDGTRLIWGQASGVGGKYQDEMKAQWVGAIFTIGSSILRATGVSGTNETIVETISGDPQDFQFPAEFTVDFSRSGYLTDQAQLSTDRTSAGDTLLASLPAPEQWDVSEDFRFGYIGIGKTVADISGQVMLQTGNMGISTGIGITFAEIGASISSLAVDSDAIIGECFIKYVGGMLSIVIDGVESTPVASAAPTIGAFAQVGANISNLSPAPGTYGELLFEVL